MALGPASVDGYRLVEPVARGRSGEVWRAVAPDGVPVAVKFHDRPDLGRSEASRLASIHHPNIVGLLGWGTTVEGRVWLALPWIDGPTLATRLRSGDSLPLEQVRRWISELASALDALHAQGMVHGDLSANNVLLARGENGARAASGDEVPILVDLSAPSFDPGPEGTTTDLALATTPRYAAPEVARGGPPGPAADRYALGLLAYEAATGAYPFPEVATPIAMLAHQASSPPVPPSEHRPDLSAAFDVALLAMLAKDADARPSTATEFAEALASDKVPAAWTLSVGQGSGRRHASLGNVALLVGLVAVGTVGLLGLRGGSDAAASPDSMVEWPAGRAAGLSCNLVDDPGFDREAVVAHFYGGDPTNFTELAPGLGVDRTTALRIGADGRFGLHGQTVAIGPHRDFGFAAWVRAEGQPELTALYVDYLDENFVQLTAERDRLGADQRIEPSVIESDADGGGRVVVESRAPAGAVYAVPTLFKNGSAGSLLVDEVVFGPIATCPDVDG